MHVQLPPFKMSMKRSCCAFRVGLWDTEGENSLVRPFFRLLSGCVLPEQDFGLLLGRDNKTGTQKLRQGWSLATPRDHHTIKTAQLAPAPPWKTSSQAQGWLLAAMWLCSAGQQHSLPYKAAISPGMRSRKSRCPKGVRGMRGPPWKGSATQQEIASVFWGMRAAGTDGSSNDNPSKICFKPPSSWSWQTNNPQE